MLNEFEVTHKEMRTAAAEVAVFHVVGYLDAHTVPRLERALEEAVAAGAAHILIDCSRLSYISSAGLGVLIDTQKAVGPRQGDLKLAAMPPAIADIFDILGFSKRMPSYPTLAEALASYGGQPSEPSQ